MEVLIGLQNSGNSRKMIQTEHAGWHGKRIGSIDCEVKEFIAWVGLVVNPTIHRQGKGKRMLRLFVTLPYLDALKEVRGGIEIDHIASLQCFIGAGLVRLDEKPDHENIVNFSYSLR